MIKLIPIMSAENGVDILYSLLKERGVDQSISHKEMPSMLQHREFVYSQPYTAWYLIRGKDYVGSIYLTKQREIGIFIFKKDQGKGFAKQAVKVIMGMWPGEFLANVNPKNKASIKLFEGLGGKHIQNTYKL